LWFYFVLFIIYSFGILILIICFIIYFRLDFIIIIYYAIGSRKNIKPSKKLKNKIKFRLFFYICTPSLFDSQVSLLAVAYLKRYLI